MSRRNRYCCEDDCGCSHTHDASCIFYKGDSVSCIPVTKGQDLDTIIQNISEYICDLDPPSGWTSVVDSCDDNIAVASTVDGNVTTYTVCLNEDIPNQIEDNTANIATILSCMSDTVYDLVSTDGSVSISVDSTVDCGRIIDLSVPPSGLPVYNGIVYSDITPATLPAGSGTDVVVKTLTRNYTTLNDIQDGDEIRFRVTGRTKGSGTTTDQMKIRFKDSGGSIVTETSFSGTSASAGIISSYIITGSIIANVAGSGGLMTLKMESNTQNNGTVGGVTRPNEIMVADVFTTLDWTQNTTLEINQVNLTSQNATDNNVTSFVVEVVKKI